MIHLWSLNRTWEFGGSDCKCTYKFFYKVSLKVKWWHVQLQHICCWYTHGLNYCVFERYSWSETMKIKLVCFWFWAALLPLRLISPSGQWSLTLCSFCFIRVMLMPLTILASTCNSIFWNFFLRNRIFFWCLSITMNSSSYKFFFYVYIFVCTHF